MPYRRTVLMILAGSFLIAAAGITFGIVAIILDAHQSIARWAPVGFVTGLVGVVAGVGTFLFVLAAEDAQRRRPDNRRGFAVIR